MKLCSSDKDIQCVENTRLQYNKCLRPCEGLYVDVKKSPVEVVQVAQYKLLMKDYANHTWFHESNILEMEDMQGNLIYLLIYWFKQHSDKLLCCSLSSPFSEHTNK